jgi:hypothetical protein
MITKPDTAPIMPPAPDEVLPTSWYREANAMATAWDTREHTTEVLAAHSGQPSIAVQDKTHGAGLPAVDRG